MSLVAFFLFVMTGFVVNHHTTYGQVPTPTLQPLPTGLPTLQPQPSGVPTLIPQPTGVPTQPPVSGGDGAVFGFVNNSDDDAFEGVTVTITGVDYSQSTETDADGYYEFKDLAGGEYTLTYEKDDYETQTQTVELEEGETLELETVTLEEVVKAKITGYVLNIKGDPIESVKLKLKGIKTGYKSTSSSDADGHFEFDNLEADTYVLVAKKKGYKGAKQTIRLEEEEETEIEIEMKKTSKRIIKVSVR